ncbi:porin family protein [Hymenobacter terricola]|uniref:porin family protein n=1 Tax=Hymenobacter terricola TaxID=2819236 RepID=UPI001B316D54|nr:porin family protein [Hymenobacter terricola]
MKHILLLLSLICCLAANSNAQESSKQFSPIEKVRFGAKVGLNVSNTNFNRGVPPPVVPVGTKWKSGIAVGFLVQVPISRAFSLQQEYLFSQMGGEITDSGTEYKFSYLSLPLLLKYGLLSRFAVFAGPQFDFLIQAKQQVSGTSLDITHDTEERSVGATAGVEYYVLKNVSLTGRYMHGLNHIGIGQRSNITEFMYESVQVAAEVKF